MPFFLDFMLFEFVFGVALCVCCVCVCVCVCLCVCVVCGLWCVVCGECVSVCLCVCGVPRPLSGFGTCSGPGVSVCACLCVCVCCRRRGSRGEGIMCSQGFDVAWGLSGLCRRKCPRARACRRGGWRRRVPGTVQRGRPRGERRVAGGARIASLSRAGPTGV